MKIGNKEYESAIIVNKDNEPVAVIDDMHIVEKDGYKVIFEEKENN